MYIRTKGTDYPCAGYTAREGLAAFRLEGQLPGRLGETVTLCRDDGFVLAEHTVADYLRWAAEGGTLILTDEPEPEPQEPAPGEDEA